MQESTNQQSNKQFRQTKTRDFATKETRAPFSPLKYGLSLLTQLKSPFIYTIIRYTTIKNKETNLRSPIHCNYILGSTKHNRTNLPFRRNETVTS